MRLSWNRYGKARIRLVKVRRSSEPHQLVDLTLDVQLEGAFEAVYVDGDNTSCLATDTMKNTVYGMARQHDITSTEAFAERLAAHFGASPGVTLVRISAVEHQWERLSPGGRPHPHAFVQPGGEQWTSVVTGDAAGIQVAAGLANLVMLKTTDSGFEGFPRDRFTTLRETTDRILATSVTASWRYRQGMRRFEARGQIRQALVDTFAEHDSRSVQHTLYAMANAALDACPDITDITMTLPNRHHLLVDLEPFGLDNPNEVFVATDQPYGVIEATVRRAGN
ncbi:MAG: urate oxidase [Luteitalea sp.]|nr:urate oxidase [Luteitalea sp.]